MKSKFLKIAGLTIICASLGVSNSMGSQQDQDWFVRIIAKDQTLGLIDRGTVLGEMSTSVDALDAHDLPEMEPFSTPYLTLVFKKDSGDGEMAEYNSDFRSLSKAPTRSAKEWRFTVKSDDPNREVTLTWESEARLDQMMMIDTLTGEKIYPVIAGKIRDYTFSMGGETERDFIWKY